MVHLNQMVLAQCERCQSMGKCALRVSAPPKITQRLVITGIKILYAIINHHLHFLYKWGKKVERACQIYLRHIDPCFSKLGPKLRSLAISQQRVLVATQAVETHACTRTAKWANKQSCISVCALGLGTVVAPGAPYCIDMPFERIYSCS